VENKVRDKLIFALDFDDLETARGWVDRLRGKVGMFKVGKQLFTHGGPQMLDYITRGGDGVFLDMKYHDIPNTVAKAVVEATRLGATMVNVHALGGREMMERTRQEVDAVCAREGLKRPLLIAVTILTSSTEQTLLEVGIDRPVEEMVPRLAALAKDSGFDGVVASPREIRAIRDICGAGFKIVTPGVRPSFASLDDQKRVATPSAAVADGADYLVVGRPISAAPDPLAAVDAILDEMNLAPGREGDRG